MLLKHSGLIIFYNIYNLLEAKTHYIKENKFSYVVI